MIWVLRWGQGWIFLLSLLGFLYGAIFEPEAVIAGLEDVAMVGQAVEESGGHLGIAEDRGPFAEAQIGGADDTGALVELAQQVEQQGATRGTEGQIAELVEDDEVGVDQAAGDLAAPTVCFFL